MSIEEKELINILCAFIQNEHFSISEHVSIEKLYDISLKHSVTAIVFEMLDTVFSDKC